MTSAWFLDLYSGLADVLAAGTRWPDWFCQPGRDWPIWLPSIRLATHWPEMSHAVTAMADVSAASRKKRQEVYEKLIIGNGSPPLPLYESQYLNGRILGPETHAVGSLYLQFGLEVEGAELPDHAAIELEFLAYLVEQEIADNANSRDWKRARRLFIEQHAGCWLPGVGRRLMKSSDPAWAVIGHLLTAVFSVPKKEITSKTAVLGLPEIVDDEACTLCGFCAQVCPTHALRIHEDSQMTRLYLESGLCVYCRKCERICDERTLKLNGGMVTQESFTILRQSPRELCPSCNKPTVSQAELAAIVARLEYHPDWLNYCLDCRVVRG